MAVLFPKYCLGCTQIIGDNLPFLCVNCRHELRQTHFDTLPDSENPMIKKFWGKVSVEKAAALLYYEKGTVSQRLIHALKYHNREQVGLWLGQWYACELAQSHYFQGVELVKRLQTSNTLCEGDSHTATSTLYGGYFNQATIQFCSGKKALVRATKIVQRTICPQGYYNYSR